jgi:hypothetical protein
MTVNVSFEYIFAGLIIILVLTTTQVYTTQLIDRKVADWQQSSGYRTIESLLDSVLLSTGEPSNWADSPALPTRFGLASINTFEDYGLDPFKVYRLNPNSTDYISPATVRSLLGISSTIGFSLRIIPALNVTIASQQSGQYDVFVRDLKGLNVPNVNVTAFQVQMPFNPYTTLTPKSVITNIEGKVHLTFTPQTNSSLVVRVGQSDILVLGTYPNPSNLLLTVQGNHVVSSTRAASFAINSTSGSKFGTWQQVSSRYAKLDGYTYFVELSLWG